MKVRPPILDADLSGMDRDASEAMKRAAAMTGVKINDTSTATQEAPAGDVARSPAEPLTEPPAEQQSSSAPSVQSTVAQPTPLRAAPAASSVQTLRRAAPEREPRMRRGTRRGQGREALRPMGILDAPWEDLSELEETLDHKLTTRISIALKLKLEWITHHRGRTSMNSFIEEAVERAADDEIKKLKRRG